MTDHAPDPRSTQELLSKVSRYEALFELAGAINAANDVASVGELLARRLKYVVDVYAWRYVCFDVSPSDAGKAEPQAIIVDGARGRAVVDADRTDLSTFEHRWWQERTTDVLVGDALREALAQLPAHLRKDDVEQLAVSTLVEAGATRALFLFSRRRRPYIDLDMKFLSMVAGFFHRKVERLWEQQRMRELEQAYLQQEVMLRQSERLATLGRLSAGMAHELNNPAAAARHGAEQLRDAVARLQRAQFALGAAGMSEAQRTRVRALEREVEARAQQPVALEPLARMDREQGVEEWLEHHGVDDAWEHAPTLVTMGLGTVQLDEAIGDFDPGLVPVVIDYIGSQFATYTLIQEIGLGAQRISDIVNALKGYSYLDQAPVQAVDIRQGLSDTLVMLQSRLDDGIDVQLRYADDLPRIQAYGSELNQVWTNLIDNAIGAMNGKGTLGIRAYREDAWVVVEVADDGPGIPPEAQDKVFDPFYTTKPPGQGTGLGLNISHSIVVQKHGGVISVESEPGATRFTVRLPINGVDLPRGNPEDHETPRPD